jgi:hypothetical protein
MKINSKKETINASWNGGGEIRHPKTRSCGYLGFCLNKFMEFAGHDIHNGALDLVAAFTICLRVPTILLREVESRKGSHDHVSAHHLDPRIFSSHESPPVTLLRSSLFLTLLSWDSTRKPLRSRLFLFFSFLINLVKSKSSHTSARYLMTFSRESDAY